MRNALGRVFVKTSISIVLLIISIIIVWLSYFEKSFLAVFFQVFALMIFVFGLFFLYFSTFYKKKKKEERFVFTKKNVSKKSVDEETEETKEDVIKKNIVSIDLDKEDSYLSEDEKVVIELLQRNEGVILQKQVTNIFSNNKVKAHRVIKSLIEKELVIKKKKGKNNTIILN
ncbi:hypothetical protein GOV05_00400 [Candidatus Woesearchaeota archaeon]|nr:hypothetical protein [Candidatus Woesearchaeota archaeon]